MVEEASLICPLCERELDMEISTCPTCGLTRAIIELEEQTESLTPEEVETVLNNQEESIITMEEKDLLAFIKKLGSIAMGSVEQVEAHQEDIVFECPICGTEVGEHDTRCPGCDAIFEGDIEDEEPSSLIDEYEKLFVKAKSEFVKIRNIPISTTIVSDLLTQSVVARNEGDYEKAIERCVEVLSVIKEITAFSSKLTSAKELLRKIREMGGQYQEHLKRLVETKQVLERGEIEEGILEAEEILNDLEKLYEFEESLLEAKNEIKRLNRYSISLPFRDKLKNSINARNEGDYQRGVKINKEVIDLINRVDNTLDIIREIREGISEMRKSGMGYKQYVDELVSAKKILDEGGLEEANREFERILEEINSKI